MGKSRGYVRIYRDIQDHVFWKDKPFTRGQAWIDLIILANHTSKTVLLGNEVIKTEAGEVITSELKLMERWGWSKKKLRFFLSILEELKMIERRPDHKKTIIVILNYSEYQKTIFEGSQNDNGKKETAEETAEETTTNPLFIRDNGKEETTEETTEDTVKRPRRDREGYTNNTLKNTLRNKYISARAQEGGDNLGNGIFEEDQRKSFKEPNINDFF